MRDVFLFPGIVGNGTRLRRLIRETPDVSSVVLLDYPDFYSNTHLLSDMQIIATHFTRTILTTTGKHDVILLGYSFGGCVAIEVGRMLEDAGLKVRYVFIIDAPLSHMTFDFDRSIQLGFLAPRTRLKQLKVSGIEFLCTTRSLRILLILFCYVCFNSYGKKLERFVVKSLRERARKETWRPAETAFPGMIFFSRQFAPITSSEWKRLCPNMSSVSIDADHLRMLEEESIAAMAACLNSCLSLPEASNESKREDDRSNDSDGHDRGRSARR